MMIADNSSWEEFVIESNKLVIVVLAWFKALFNVIRDVIIFLNEYQRGAILFFVIIVLVLLIFSGKLSLDALFNLIISKIG